MKQRAQGLHLANEVEALTMEVSEFRGRASRAEELAEDLRLEVAVIEEEATFNALAIAGVLTEVVDTVREIAPRASRRAR